MPVAIGITRHDRAGPTPAEFPQFVVYIECLKVRLATYNQMIMDSKLANESRRDLVASAKRLTREERLRAFVRHSKLVMDLAKAAKRARTKSRGGD